MEIHPNRYINKVDTIKWYHLLTYFIKVWFFHFKEKINHVCVSEKENDIEDITLCIASLVSSKDVREILSHNWSL